MIQFNLLPDIKLEYIRAARTKRLAILFSVLVSAVVIAVNGVLAFSTFYVQAKHISNLSSDIDQRKQELEGTESIDEILTIQNQLSTLTGLHEQKPELSRAYDFLQSMTPSNVYIADVNIDLAEGTFEISGQADELVDVNKYVDTIKFTQYRIIPEQEEGAEEQIVVEELEKVNAFSEVVLSNFTIDDEETSYSIVFKFDPLLFDNTKNVQFLVPNKVTTRSQVERPLFQQPKNDEENQ